MTLPKHLRPRWRYLALGIQTWPDVALTRAAFQSALWREARSLLGDVGSARTGLRLFEFSYDTGRGEAVVRTHRHAVSDARAVVACISDIDDTPIGIRVRGISGTVRGCEEKYLGRQPELFSESTVVFADAERTAVQRTEAVDVRIGEAFVGATPLDIE